MSLQAANAAKKRGSLSLYAYFSERELGGARHKMEVVESIMVAAAGTAFFLVLLSLPCTSAYVIHWPVAPSALSLTF